MRKAPVPASADFRRGYLYVSLAAVLWAVSGTAAKFLFHLGMTPFELVQTRLTVGCGVLFLWFLLRSPGRLRIDRGDIVYFAVFGTAGMALVQFTYLFAISKINVAAAILLQYTAPVFITLHALVFLHRRPRRIVVVSLVAALFGCYLMVGGYNWDLLSMNLMGVFSGMMSAVGFAWYSVHGEYGLKRYSPWTVLFYALFFATIVWNILHPPLESLLHLYPLRQWFWMAYIGVLGTLVPFGLYLKGIGFIRAARASIAATLEPITAGVISYIFLHEILEPLQLFGGALVIAAIILLQLERPSGRQANGP